MSDPPILVVDDEESLRELLVEALAAEGYSSLAVPHGAAALELLREVRPGLIVLDLRMPIMDGWTFARSYLAAPGPHAPIVVLTAAPDPPGAAAELGADAALAKPFALDDLLSVVEKLYRPSRPPDTPNG